MKKRIFFSLLISSVIFLAAGCGGGKSLSGTDNKLTGQWVAEKLNAKGDRILLVFNEESIKVPANPADDNPYNPYDKPNTKDPHSIRIVAIRPGGDTFSVDVGVYDIEKNKILFDLSEISDFESPYTVTEPTAEAPGQLTLGTEVYFKVTGNLDGPQLGGQIQVSQTVGDEGVTVSSVKTSSMAGRPIRNRILVKFKPEGSGGGGDLGSPSPAALTVSSVSSKLSTALSTVMVNNVVQRAGYSRIDLRELMPLGLASLTVAGAPRTLSEIAAARVDALDQLNVEGEKALETLKKDPTVEWAVFDRVLGIASFAEPTDTLYAEQWNLDAMNVTDAWAAVTPTKEVVVAVIDTGIVDHPELTGKVLKTDGYDFVHDKIPGIEDLDLDGVPGPDNDPTDPGDHQTGLGLPGGSSWHGTHISGIIASAIDNGAGIAGIAPSVKILPIRAMGFEGNGTLDDVAQAIYYAAKLKNVADCATGTAVTDGAAAGTFAIDESSAAWTTCDPSTKTRPKADIINLSLGAPLSPLDAAPLNEAINDASAAGVLIVAAAGNEAKGPGYCVNSSGSYVSDPTCAFYPAANPNVISIGAVYANLTFAAAYSNYGGDTNNSQFLVAPGGSGSASILSTVHPSVLGGYAELMGTSQAAAHVSGVAALVWSDTPALTVNQMKQALSASAVDLGTPGRDKYYGYGLVNACGALLKGREIAGSPSALTGTLRLSSNNVDFGPMGTTHTVVISGGCGSVSGITATKHVDTGPSSWLAATLTSGTTPSQMTFTINREGLPPGDYTATVTVNSSAGSLPIAIKMKVGTATTSGGTEAGNLRKEIEDFLAGGGSGFKNEVDMGEVIILLIDADSGSAQYYTKTDFTANYNFQFGGIAPGSYYVLAGVDANLDGNICVAGEDEPCFAYPSLTNPEAIEVTATTKKNDLVLIY
ncbi:MAG TPA: S8 family serine peptidase [bacterium]|nr:S8 family serine peptidase [bacterium]